jgi:hypothetical protein
MSAEQASGRPGEQISTERLKLHNLGMLALSVREQNIVVSREAAVRMSMQERLRAMEILGIDPSFPASNSQETSEPLSDVGYRPQKRRIPLSGQLLYVAM